MKTSFKEYNVLKEFAIAPSKSYQGMSHEYLSASIREGEVIYDGITEYVNKYGKDAIGQIVVLNDLEGVPLSIRKKYENLQIRITSNFQTKFKKDGDDDSWEKNRFLRNPLKGMWWSYKDAVMDAGRKQIAAKTAVNKEWEDYHPVFHASTLSKANFVKEWIYFKQMAMTKTYYYMTHTNPRSFSVLANNRISLAARASLVLVHPVIALPLNLLISFINFKLAYNYFNDPIEVEAYAAFFIEMKRNSNQFNKRYFASVLNTREIVPKDVFIAHVVSAFNIQTMVMNKTNKETFENILYHEYLKVMGGR